MKPTTETRKKSWCEYMAEKKPEVTSFFREEAKKWVARTTFAVLVVFATTLFTPWMAAVKALLAMPAKLEELAVIVARNSKSLRALAGDNKITNQPQGFSYVREPVIGGDPINVVLFVKLTELGEGCRLIEVVPVFTDPNEVAIPGVPIPVVQQLTDQIQRRALTIPQPEGLKEGRTRVELQMHFLCDNELGQVFELTDPLFYYSTSPN